MYICMYICMYEYMHEYMYVCMYVCAQLCIYCVWGATLTVSGIASPQRAIAVLVSIPALTLSTREWRKRE